MQARLKILVFIDWFYPAYKAGGPIKSVFTIVQSLKSYFDFLIVTSNKDLDRSVLELPTDTILNSNACNVIYLEDSQQSARHYKKIATDFQPDVIYYNSLFSWKFTLLPYLAFRNSANIKHILAPRGMFGAGSLSIKPLKKKLFLKIAKHFIFKKSIRFHASSQIEATDIKKKMGDQWEIVIAQNLAASHSQEKRKRIKKSGSLKLVFLSRILVIKNLHFALGIMGEFVDEQGLSLDIYGPIEDQEYWKKCQKIMQLDSRISYKGICKPQEVATIAQNYDFLILPTKHENYGHVIVEFLLARTPVMISQFTPWSKLEKHQVGFDLPIDNKEPWKEKIQQLIEMDHEKYVVYESACQIFSTKYILKEETLLANKFLFDKDIDYK